MQLCSLGRSASPWRRVLAGLAQLGAQGLLCGDPHRAAELPQSLAAGFQSKGPGARSGCCQSLTPRPRNLSRWLSRASPGQVVTGPPRYTRRGTGLLWLGGGEGQGRGGCSHLPSCSAE